MSRTFMDIMYDLDEIKRELDEKIFNEVVANEWMPCSEKLPEEGVPVLVCFTDWQTQEKTIDVSCLRDRNLWDDHGRYNKECVAWMPLPDPWKGGE